MPCQLKWSKRNHGLSIETGRGVAALLAAKNPMPSSSREIPLVDFAPLTSADDSARRHILTTLRSALETSGFMYLRNHGVAQSLVKAVFAQSRQFFSLSLEAKNRAKPKETGSTRGYEGVGGQALEVGRPGDLIARWTNGRVRSSPHRVVNPTGPAAINQRYSFLLFHSPNPDTVISCLEPCQGPGNPPKFAPITAGEHLRARAEASRRHGY